MMETIQEHMQSESSLEEHERQHRKSKNLRIRSGESIEDNVKRHRSLRQEIYVQSTLEYITSGLRWCFPCADFRPAHN